MAYLTAVAVVAQCGRLRVEFVDTTRVTFRELDEATIERYVARESPLDCAGAFKSEGLGISLCESIDSEDPSALIGLPLIRLCAVLRGSAIRSLEARRRLAAGLFRPARGRFGRLALHGRNRIEHRREFGRQRCAHMERHARTRPIERNGLSVQKHAPEAVTLQLGIALASPYLSSPSSG